jgi:hypothetical protein
MKIVNKIIPDIHIVILFSSQGKDQETATVNNQRLRNQACFYDRDRTAMRNGVSCATHTELLYAGQVDGQCQ